MCKGQEHAEVEFIVGPIPIDDGVGKEFATKIRTNLACNKTSILVPMDVISLNVFETIEKTGAWK